MNITLIDNLTLIDIVDWKSLNTPSSMPLSISILFRADLSLTKLKTLTLIVFSLIAVMINPELDSSMQLHNDHILYPLID